MKITPSQVEAQRNNITEAKMTIMKDIYKTQNENSTGMFSLSLLLNLYSHHLTHPVKPNIKILTCNWLAELLFYECK